jgi:Kdo2-lipid IVA 3' secondary acyltransferase
MGFLKTRPGTIKRIIISRLLSGLIKLISVTWRVTIENKELYENLTKSGKSFIIIFWHGEMLMGWFYHRNKRYSCLVSMSRDGDILAEILTLWNYRVIRGSSSRGGKEARGMMEEEVRSGNVLVVTPDGPRGPRYEMKMGAVRTAQKTSAPLLPVRFIVNRSYILESWDRFEIPIPFARIIIRYLEPLIIDRTLEGTALTECKDMIQRRMNQETVRVENK